MSEWWTYVLRDLLLFSQRTYFRLFELHNLEWWPLPLVTLALGVLLVALAWRGGERAERASLVLLAVCWAWVAWAWHAQRYASINWTADYLAWAWAAQAVLLVLAALRRPSRPSPDSRPTRWLGLGLLVYAVILHPLLAPAHGQGWPQAEVFGMAPDPTAIATLGALLAAHVRCRAGLLGLPLAWCLVSAATLWAMAAPAFFVPLLAAGVALAGVSVRR